MEKYTIVRELGQGRYGTSYLAIDNFDKSEVAIKIIPKDEYAYNEIKFHSELSKITNIVPKFIEYFELNNEFYIVMEFIRGDTVYDVIEKNKSMDFIWMILYHILIAIKTFHQTGFYHGDLHIQNILWVDNKIRIIDFGFTCDITCLEEHSRKWQERRRLEEDYEEGEEETEEETKENIRQNLEYRKCLDFVIFDPKHRENSAREKTRLFIEEVYDRPDFADQNRSREKIALLFMIRENIRCASNIPPDYKVMEDVSVFEDKLLRAYSAVDEFVNRKIANIQNGSRLDDPCIWEFERVVEEDFNEIRPLLS